MNTVSIETMMTEQPTIGMTEHMQDDDHRVLVLVNYEPEDQTACVQLKPGWTAVRVLGLNGEMAVEHGDGKFILPLNHNDGAFVFLQREASATDLTNA